jgi:DNA-directed RNA polymerase subunit N (RpoN/RPB10)
MMAWIVQLLIPRRRKNQHDLAGRAAEVVAHVLSDIGIDRFLNGTMLVDHRLRVRFVSCGVAIGSVHAAVRADSLAQARALRGGDGDGGPALAAQALQQQIARLVEELMAALLNQSATLRALPERRYRIAGRRTAASK